MLNRQDDGDNDDDDKIKEGLLRIHEVNKNWCPKPSLHLLWHGVAFDLFCIWGWS